MKKKRPVNLNRKPDGKVRFLGIYGIDKCNLSIKSQNNRITGRKTQETFASAPAISVFLFNFQDFIFLGCCLNFLNSF